MEGFEEESSHTVGRNGRKSLLEVKTPSFSASHESGRKYSNMRLLEAYGFGYMLRMLNQSPASDSE